jgi:ribonuclease D
MSDSNYQWLADTGSVTAWLQALPPDAPIHLDTEFMREREFHARLALVQVRAGERRALIDPIGVEPDSLAPLVRGRHLVMHGCSEDLEVLYQNTGLLPARLEDTQIAAALAGDALQCSYQRLVDTWLGVALPKGETRTDWLQRPLSPEQLHYAAQDVEYLPELAERLRERLAGLDRLEWWREECARMLDEAAVQPALEDLWRQVKGSGRLDAPARSALQALAAWRENQARTRNRARGFVVRDADLLTLAQQRPASRNQLKQLELHPALIRRHGDALLEVLAGVDPGDAPPAPPPPPDRDQRALIKRLRAEVTRRAGELELAPEVLMRRRWLEALVRDPEQVPAALQGWRRWLITEPLLELMA